MWGKIIHLLFKMDVYSPTNLQLNHPSQSLMVLKKDTVKEESMSIKRTGSLYSMFE